LRRIFVPPDRIAGGRAALPPESAHYLRDVLRLEPGAALEAFDGEGGVYPAVVAADGASLTLGERADARAPGATVWLAFALAKGDRNELVVQKATELGASRLLPFEAERSVVRLDGARAAGRRERWSRIAAEAARQCGRADVPEVALPAALPRILAAAPSGFARVLFYEGGGEPLAAAAPPGASGYLALIGPEGGFSDAEVRACLDAGCRPATLGPRVLRAETAAILAAALLQHLYGDLSRA
jgi:16S rRNA (uracil1498-N3)-methyltransferase